MSTRQQRKAIALRLAEIATKHGATVEIDDEGPYHVRNVHVDCRFPEIAVSFDVDDLFKGGILANWYGAKRDLRHHRLFDSINTIHFSKATTFRPDVESFAQWFDEACAAVVRGDVFA